MIRIALALIAVSLPFAAVAERGACRADVERLCASERGEKAAVRACLEANEAQLSEACQAQRLQRAERKEAREAKRGERKGAREAKRGERKEAREAKRGERRAACAEDRAGLCAEVSGRGAVRACLEANLDALTDACRATFEAR